MTTAPPQSSRASLLAGLRTGGVRSTSGAIPHTAAPGGAFNVPRFLSQHQSADEEDDQVAEIPATSNIFANNHHRAMPMTAAVDGPGNRFSQQQRGMNPNSLPFSPGFAPNMMGQPNQAQAQAFQLQMMQLELMKIQALQNQQYQTELLAEAQRQQQNKLSAPTQRLNSGFHPPATAGPLSTSFDLRSATLSAQMRRANQADHLRSQLGVSSPDQLPMTAALGGKFGSRSVSGPSSRFSPDDGDELAPPLTPNSTTVISGGTSLGSPASNNISFNNTTPSKSDSVSSWRRGGNNNSVLSGNRSFTSPSVKITPPPSDRISPPLSSAAVSTPSTATPNTAGIKFRPQPLRFSAAVSQPLPVVAIDSSSSEMIDNDDSSSSSSKSNSNSSPTTPRSSSSNDMPLSPREEAAKKLYEGLGIGRPASAVGGIGPHVTVGEEQQYTYQLPVSAMMSHRMASQPMRQPRGPPSGADELGPKNFATRIRRKAIGGLGMLMGARERREFIEAY